MNKLERRDLDSVVDKIGKILHSLTEQHIASYTTKAHGLVVEGSTWVSKVVAHIRDLKTRIDEVASQCKKNMLHKVESSSRKEHERRMKDLVHKSMTDLSPEIAKEISTAYKGGINDFNNNLKDVLIDGFSMSATEAYEFLSENERNIHTFSEGELKTAGMHVSTHILRQFTSKFKKDENGASREWRNIEGGEATILEIFKACKEKIDVII